MAIRHVPHSLWVRSHRSEYISSLIHTTPQLTLPYCSHTSMQSHVGIERGGRGQNLTALLALNSLLARITISWEFFLKNYITEIVILIDRYNSRMCNRICNFRLWGRVNSLPQVVQKCRFFDFFFPATFVGFSNIFQRNFEYLVISCLFLSTIVPLSHFQKYPHSCHHPRERLLIVFRPEGSTSEIIRIVLPDFRKNLSRDLIHQIARILHWSGTKTLKLTPNI